MISKNFNGIWFALSTYEDDLLKKCSEKTSIDELDDFEQYLAETLYKKRLLDIIIDNEKTFVQTPKPKTFWRN